MEKGILFATILTGAGLIGLIINKTFDLIFILVLLAFIVDIIMLLRKTWRK